MTDAAGLARKARQHAAEGGWVSRSRTRTLSIQAVGADVTVSQPPAREGTVVRRVADGVQREWAVPGWHDDWVPQAQPPEKVVWVGDNPVDRVPLKDKVDWVREVRARLAARDPRVVQSMAFYAEQVEERHITSRDVDRSSRLARVVFAVVAVVADRGRTDQNRILRAHLGGFDDAPQLDDAALDAMVEEALLQLEAVPIAPGTYRAVIAPEVSGVLAHEAFGHGVEMDLFLSGRAHAAQAMGQRVGSPLATIVDDPTLAGAYASYPFDDDGTLAARHVILDRGVLVGGLSDDEVRGALGATGGNGRRQDYSRKVYPRMSNTFFEPGTDTVDNLIRGVESGVYLRQVDSGTEDPKGWGMQIVIHAAREIREGRLTGRRFRTMSMTGYVPDVLSTIDGAATDFALLPGQCGKGWKEWVNVATGGPHLRLTARLG